jgi:ADP-heptose:LPS heptosyltransferase
VNILIYRLGSLGDTIVALPAFRVVRRAYPGARITALTNTPVSEKAAPLMSILENTGLIDEAIDYPVGLRDPARIAALRRQLQDGRFDLAVSLAASRGLAASLRDWLFFKACRIPRVIGIPLARRDLACQPVGGGLYEPEAERLLRRVGRLGAADLRDPQWRDLSLTAEENAAASRLLTEAGIHGDFMAASLGSKFPHNDWGTENWRDLLSQLGAAFPALGLVLLGSGGESARNEMLLAAWPGPRANLCGKTPPRVSAALLHKARLHLGHDSGPMHLAAAAGTRCVSIFSAKNPPGQWFPFGEGHFNLYPADRYDPARDADLGYQFDAISAIRVADVLAAATTCLSQPRA